MDIMPIGDFKVTYTDGTDEIAISNFLGLVEVERRWPGSQETPGITALATAVFFYLGCPGEDLDAWLGRVHMIERQDDDKVEDVDDDESPTQPAVGAA